MRTTVIGAVLCFVAATGCLSTNSASRDTRPASDRAQIELVFAQHKKAWIDGDYEALLPTHCQAQRDRADEDRFRRVASRFRCKSAGAGSCFGG